MDSRATSELTAILAEECITEITPLKLADYVVELSVLAGRIGRRAVQGCNYEFTPRMERADNQDYSRVAEIVQELGLPGFKRQSDARGYAIKFLLRSGRYNSMGGREEGWGI